MQLFVSRVTPSSPATVGDHVKRLVMQTF